MNHKTIIAKNFVFLGAVQFFNMVAPILLIPYLVRNLGLVSFGHMSFFLVYLFFYQMTVDFGNSIVGARKVSILAGDKNKISYLISTIYTLKVFISILLFPLYYLLSTFILPQELNQLIIFGYLQIVIFAFIPDWYFNGVERNFSYMIFVAISKSVQILMVLYFVKTESDIHNVILANIASLFVLLVMTNYFLISNERLKLTLVTIESVFNHFFECIVLFSSKFLIEMYRSLNVIFLGYIASPIAVSYYVIAEKIITALQTLQFPLGKALLPRSISYLKTCGIETYLSKVFLLIKYIFILYVLIAVTVYLSAEKLIYLFSGESAHQSVRNLKLLSLVILFGGLNYILNVLFFQVLALDKLFMRILVITSLASVFTSLFLISSYDDFGAVLSIVFAEVLLFVLILFAIRIRA